MNILLSHNEKGLETGFEVILETYPAPGSMCTQVCVTKEPDTETTDTDTLVISESIQSYMYIYALKIADTAHTTQTHINDSTHTTHHFISSFGVKCYQDSGECGLFYDSNWAAHTHSPLSLTHIHTHKRTHRCCINLVMVI